MGSSGTQGRKNEYCSQGGLWSDWKHKGGILQIPTWVFMCDDFKTLNNASVRVLIALLCQYNGANNGDLSATKAEMIKHGIRSSDTINRSVKELIEHGFIVKTRNGYAGVDGRRMCSLYALTWLRVDDIGIKSGDKWIPTVKGTKRALRLDFSGPYDGSIQYEAA
ncbi:MarR family transcriptional regulator [Tolumonas osonensis]|uniref:Putative transcriptional regulator n=1 Tax=Tolumonas osonensis TaxID=675874 RepID=A0A841GLU4_9GAMM|nr:helix-turn-helix domain-containing protein [Tolumonas osonensis]MBB6054463.1 putative transcriptional regulator [Tolumonas osonensis]